MIKFENVSVTYPGGVEALKDLDLEINEGDFIIIVGLSGAGKSTLLRTINNLVKPTNGTVYLEGKDVTNAKKRDLKNIRSQIGMIFQTFNLVNRSTVLKNVLTGRLSLYLLSDPYLGYGLKIKNNLLLKHLIKLRY